MTIALKLSFSNLENKDLEDLNSHDDLSPINTASTKQILRTMPAARLNLRCRAGVRHCL